MAKKFVFILLGMCLYVCMQHVVAQRTSVLSPEKIMKGDEWIGHQPGNFRWSDDSRQVWFMWNPDNNPSDSLYIYDLETGEATRATARQRRHLSPVPAAYNKERTKKVYVRNGDLFLDDLQTSQTIKLLSTLQAVSSPSFTKDEKGISYVAGNNLFLYDLKSGTTSQITDFRRGRAPSADRTSDQDLWLENQQTELFDVLRARKELDELRREQRERDRPERPLEIYTGNATVRGIQLSPGERFVTYMLAVSPDARQTMMPDYVTMSGYTEEQSVRPKVGAPQMTTTLGIYDRGSGKSYNVKTVNIPGLRDVPEYMRDYGFAADELESDREVAFTALFWSPDGKRAVVNIRAMDNKDRWIMLLDPETGNLSPLDRQRDEAWIAGPGINVWGNQGMGWLPDNKTVWFQSEESGYSHLYTIDITNGKKSALTSGEFEVYSPRLSRNKKYWYFTSNEVHPGERHFYRMPVSGGSRTQITSAEGRHDVVISPDERTLAIRYSYYNKPWELYMMENEPGAEMKRVTRSLSGEFLAYEWRVPELLTYTAGDGEEVWARLYRPDNPEPGGPAVIFVHGAGYLQNAHKWWSSYHREYMFHNLLVDLGYTVLDTDFRASAGYGRDWRTGIYRHMGGKDLSDNVDGARFLVEKYGIDPGRIGIYGGSYGGFITLMAMFNYPEVFAAGAALRSVTDWAHYSHGYTSNILNTPVCDSLAYVRSSPVYFAEGLEGALLMCHGMVDDNVHFQDIVRLTQRLIELGRENWELAVYPVERHAFTETSSWVDQYRRILKLFEDYLW